MFLVLILVIAAAFVTLFIVLYPPLGKKPSVTQREAFQQYAPNYNGKMFLNQIPTPKGIKAGETAKVMLEFIKGSPERQPSTPIEVVPLVLGSGKEACVAWLGHSAVWVEIGGKKLFLDPMLGNTPSPFPLFGGKRYSRRLPFDIEALPEIDAVLFSHDHYDHLDYGSIQKLKGKVRRFIVPLGVGAHLVRWGVPKSSIEEHAWGDEFEFEGLKLACTPARHFSGRGTTGSDSTLWCSWVIDSGEDKLFFSGDSGYGPHFREIGEAYGPFDLTLIECGQYDERWASIHMLPEESVQAHLDVKGKRMVAIHWAGFTLALHAWNDPVERVTQAAKQRGVEIATPRIGEAVSFHSADYPRLVWWK